MTQHEKIIKQMETDPDRWWLPQDFMRPELGELFVGYEASARLSEMAKLGLVESKRQGKYIARKLIVQQPEPPKVEPVQPLPTQTRQQEQLFDIPVAPPTRQYM